MAIPRGPSSSGAPAGDPRPTPNPPPQGGNPAVAAPWEAQRPAAPATSANTAAPRRSAAPTGARGAPPATVQVDESDDSGGSGREVRDRKYWEDHPFRVGTYALDAYVAKIMDWGVNGPSVTFNCLDWQAAAGGARFGRPGEHHQRPVDWEQQMRAEQVDKQTNPRYTEEEREKACRAYAHHRRRLVACYVGIGRPEETWEADPDGNPVPPWYDFFVRRMPDGVVVPVVLRLEISVEPKRQRWPQVRGMSIRLDAQAGFFQSMLPHEVPPWVADRHGWRIAEVRDVNVQARVTDSGFRYDAFATASAKIDRDCVPLGHAGLRTYKELS